MPDLVTCHRCRERYIPNDAIAHMCPDEENTHRVEDLEERIDLLQARLELLRCGSVGDSIDGGVERAICDRAPGHEPPHTMLLSYDGDCINWWPSSEGGSS